MLQCNHVNKLCSFYLQNADLHVCSDHKPLLHIFTGYTDNYKCNKWGLELSAIPRRVKVQQIKGIANILTDSVSRLKSVGIYHDTDSNDHQLEFSTPFELLPPVKPVAHTPLEMNETVITPDTEGFMQGL